ncbi:4Fe-4S binding domain-containing protein [Anaerocolumna jejuensis DSM 15929]|uniref:4Fe-4S binding domain-containing protein n=1 Tax=Anaerocolumna jejuensis DSM 15929 TaxID=1121322 RepID=A0A1M6PY86_9FIRM|nr:EFR1 family ferrodoxin [Anaerocolumna jejuensis]SHK12872.1 4Fe-4S binding domain-containing protein [Anaerocolumna jejuensis DSM 15929]
MILYFTGTGNSRYAANLIADATEDEMFSMNEGIKKGDYNQLSSSKPYVFVMPTYAWRIPRIADAFLRKAAFSGSKKAYFVMTCGSQTGNAVYYLKKLCLDKGFEFMGISSIIMPENYIAMYNAPDKTEALKIIENSKPHILQTAECIKKEMPLPKENISPLDRFQSTAVNPLFYSIIVSDKGFYSTDSCISCGKCVTLCPINNVHLKVGRPEWSGNCTHCMACICGCPKEAIEYRNKSKGKPRYFLSEKP